MEQVIKSGTGWRIGWNPNAPEFKGLVGTQDWAIELTEAELNEFCRLLNQLADTMKHLATELMDTEKIVCEAESDLLWMEVEGYPHAYSLRFILNTGRGTEGKWEASAVSELLPATGMLKVF
ncbi:MAG: DUF1818 family protein [Aphanizomenon sp.]|jgi:hypothetical protein|uniref:DUF1818 domain-containing protein n=1 Tax=Aphanizomenon flos-aquae LD13 TaxID=1710894 RepID=A0A1B7VSD1_APHFL|nr:DUF1818 family protein [Aphanizomenon flos-aquae UKL13-PB]MBO1059813.1 DUF1818 family protein [Aphanizomenon flos-aquae CP01]OBQ23850.1 MAG: hypothetical protein AN481_14540 [Aphanizomenon flos-aquae LD13]OBQ29990.1 MAG: hypothetical protein AN483_07670 [Aphanizomenon flos-aquae MDT14a]HCQ21283.1 DUF1818 domain-containing protein [Anabaena sp. UBA12330]